MIAVRPFRVVRDETSTSDALRHWTARQRELRIDHHLDAIDRRLERLTAAVERLVAVLERRGA